MTLATAATSTCPALRDDVWIVGDGKDTPPYPYLCLPDEELGGACAPFSARCTEVEGR